MADRYVHLDTNLLDDLEELVTQCRADYEKTINGNRAAGSRVRKRMAAIKKQAHGIRKHVCEVFTHFQLIRAADAFEQGKL